MTFDELQLNNLLYRNSQTVDTNTPVSASNNLSDEVQSENLISGELAGNLLMVDGFLRSKGYEAGVSGWTINADDSVEFGSGTFRGTINATAGYIGSGTSKITIDSTGLLIGTSGKIRTADTGARLEIVKTIDDDYSDGLKIYDSSNFQTCLLGLGVQTLSLFGNDSRCPIVITDTGDIGAGGLGQEISISIQGTQHGITLNTTGSTSRSEKACFYANNQSDKGMAFYAKGDTGYTNVNPLYFAEPSSNRGDVLKQTAASFGQISNISNYGFIQYPAYHHRSDFDENISGDTLLASTVLAKAHWVGGGVGTQTLIDGDFQATYIQLATTAVTETSSTLQFHRKLCRSGINSAVEFRVQVNDITNVVIQLGLYYDATHYVYFLFDSLINAANIYAARANAAAETRTDTTADLTAEAWKHFKLFFTSDGYAHFYQNEDLLVSVSTNLPTGSNLTPYAYIYNRAAENKILSIDSIEFWSQKNNAASLTD